jgi:hypothetical protein
LPSTTAHVSAETVAAGVAAVGRQAAVAHAAANTISPTDELQAVLNDASLASDIPPAYSGSRANNSLDR